MTGGLPELYAAVTPCALGYAQVARYITENYPKLPSNPYQAWIDAYSASEYQQAAQETVDFLTVLCDPLNDSQLANIQQILPQPLEWKLDFGKWD